MKNGPQQLGDLPDDIGTDHNQLIDVARGDVSTRPTPGETKPRPKIQVPVWVKWLADRLIPNLLPSLQLSVKTVVIGVVTQQVSQGNPSRRYLLIQNNSLGNIFINFDQDAAAGRSVIVVPGGYYEPYRVPKNSIHVSAALASSTVVIVEG